MKNDYESAILYANSKDERSSIQKFRGDALFAKHAYQEAAAAYANSSISFEEAALKFIDLGSQDALMLYLQHKLASLGKAETAQRISISTWLLELTLASSPDSETLRDFFQAHKDILHYRTVYAMLNRHDPSTVLVFAEVIQDFDRVVQIHTESENWDKVLHLMARQATCAMVIEYSTKLVLAVPDELVSLWLKFSDLSPRAVLPCMLKYELNKQTISTPSEVLLTDPVSYCQISGTGDTTRQQRHDYPQLPAASLHFVHTK